MGGSETLGLTCWRREEATVLDRKRLSCIVEARDSSKKATKKKREDVGKN